MEDPTASTLAPSAPAPTAHSDEMARREFFKKVACVGLGGCALLGPIVAGAVVVAHPLIEKGGEGVLVKLALLEDLPLGSAPQLFQVLTEPSDAWLKFSRRAIGSVFLLRRGPREVMAFNALCPHVSGPIMYREGSNDFYCPLHQSSFDLGGERQSESTPSPRDMDSLPVEVRGEEVWVRFQNYTPNIAAKTPV